MFVLQSNPFIKPFFISSYNQSSKVINDENALYHVPFLIALKSVVMFTNEQDMYSIIYRNYLIINS